MELVFPAIGWVYLWIRYRNKEKVQIALRDKYENNYGLAATLVISKILAVMWTFLLVSFLIIAIFGAIRHSVY
jgi:hypothetical protein